MDEEFNEEGFNEEDYKNFINEAREEFDQEDFEQAGPDQENSELLTRKGESPDLEEESTSDTSEEEQAHSGFDFGDPVKAASKVNGSQQEDASLQKEDPSREDAPQQEETPQQEKDSSSEKSKPRSKGGGKDDGGKKNEKSGIRLRDPVALPKGFSMDTPGVLSINEPVTAERLNAFLDYVEENRQALMLSGQWSEPTSICFNPKDAADGSRVTVVFDKDIAETINSRLSTVDTLEMRNGSFSLLREEDGANPLNRIERLGRIHMFGGVSEVKDLFSDLKQVHISIGITGSRTNEVNEGELLGVPAISIAITGGSDGPSLMVGKNALGMDPIHERDIDLTKGAFRKTLADVGKNDGIQYSQEHLLSVRDMMKTFLNDNFRESSEYRVGTSLKNALDSVSAGTRGEELTAFLKEQIGGTLGMKAEEVAGMSNRAFAERVAGIVNVSPLRKLSPERLERIEAIMTSDTTLNVLGVPKEESGRNVAKKDIHDGIRSLVKMEAEYSEGRLSLQDYERTLQDVKENNRLFGRALMEGSIELEEDGENRTYAIADLFLDTSAKVAMERLEAIPENVYACYETRDGERSFSEFRMLDSDDRARSRAEYRSVDSFRRRQGTLDKALQELTNHLRSTGIKEKNDDVRNGLTSMASNITELAGVYRQFDHKVLAEMIERDLKTSVEVNRNGQADAAGKGFFVNGNVALDAGAIAGRKDSFYNKGGESDYMFVKLGSELMESLVRFSMNVNKKIEKLETDKEQGKYVDPLELEALHILKERVDVNGIDPKNEISEKMRILKMDMDVLRNSAVEQRKILEKALEIGERTGLNPKEVSEIFKDSLHGRNNTVGDDGKGRDDDSVEGLARQYARLQENSESKRKAFISTMSGIRNYLGEAMVPRIYERDAEGRQVIGKDGKPMTTSMFGDVMKRRNPNVLEEIKESFKAVGNDGPIREFDVNDEMKEFFDGITEIDVDVSHDGKIGSSPLPIQFLATWRNFSEFAGIDSMDPDPKNLKPADKTLFTSSGTVLGDGALEGTGITNVQERRVSMYRHEFDRIYRRQSEVRDEADRRLNEIRKNFASMGISMGPGGNSDWERVFKPAFERLATDPSLQPETVNTIRQMANTVMVCCRCLEDSEKWLSENPDVEEYRFNQSPYGAKLNDEIKALKGQLAMDDITQEQRNFIENQLGSLQEKKNAFIKDGMNTICGDNVSSEVRNVSANTRQEKSNTCAWPKVFGRNDADGRMPKVALNEKPPLGEVLWGVAKGSAEDFAAYGKRFMTHYRHMSIPESLIKILAVMLKAAFATMKLFFNIAKLGYVQHELDKADAYKTMVNVMDRKFDGKPPIEFKRPGVMGGVYEFTSKEAEDFCRRIGVTLDNTGKRTMINVDLNKATGGRAVGTVSMMPNLLMDYMEKGEVPRCVTMEKMNRTWNRYAKETIHDWSVKKANKANAETPYQYANAEKEAQRQKEVARRDAKSESKKSSVIDIKKEGGRIYG